MPDECLSTPNLTKNNNEDENNYSVKDILFDTENFLISLDTQPICDIHFLITPKNYFSFYSSLSTEMWQEFKSIVKCLKIVTKVENFILFEHVQDVNSQDHAHMHFIGNIDCDKEFFIENIKDKLGENNKNIESYFFDIEHFKFEDGPYLFCFIENKIFFLNENRAKISIQFFRSIFENNSKENIGITGNTYLLAKYKSLFENKVMIYSLLHFFQDSKKKLVRDKIPEIAFGSGFDFCRVDERRFLFFLKQKLVEEVNEVLNTIDDDIDDNYKHLKEEIADVMEVLDGIMNFYKISKKDIDLIKENKKLLRGGFLEKILLK